MTIRRILFVVIGLFLAPNVLGQTSGLASALGVIADSLRREGKIDPLDQRKPTEPLGFPQVGDQRPMPSPDPNISDAFNLHSAGRTTGTGDEFSAVRNVKLSFRGYDVSADRIDGNRRTEIFTLTGNALLVGKDAVVRGNRIAVNFKDRSFRFLDGNARLGPSFVQGRLLSDLFIRGEEGGGTEQESNYENALVTTCDRDDPHYAFLARKANIKPGRRAVLRDVRVQILGRTVLRIPYLVIPLRRYSERYVPEFGHSPDEGYYVKSRFGTPLHGDDFFDTRVDYFTKLGVGIGGDYNYFGRRLEGRAQAYTLSGGPRTFSSSWQHRQDLLKGNFSFDGSYQRNNYLTSPSSAQLLLRSGFALPWRGGTSRLSYLRSGSESGGFSSVQEVVGLADQRQITSTLTTSLDMSLNRNRTASDTSESVERKQLDVKFRGSQDFHKLSADLEYQRSIPIGAIDNFFSPTDRTPLFTLRSDSRRLLGQRSGGRLPFQTQFSVGQFLDGSSQKAVTRSNFEFNTQTTQRSGNATVDWSNRFRQGVYSDNTAQYLLNTDLGYGYRLGKDTALRLRYSYLRPYGYSPLNIDRTGKTNLFTADLSVRPLRSLLLSAQTAYDILRLDERQTPWQTIGIRSEWRPTSVFQLRAQSNYDTFQQAWSNVRLDLGWQVADGFLSAGSRYDGLRHTWGNVNLFADGLKWGRLRTSVLFAYNGYNKQFEAQHFSFIYDMHCTEAILQIINNPVGFRSGTEIAFFIRIKALPFDTPFGVGRRGNAVGSGTGFGF